MMFCPAWYFNAPGDMHTGKVVAQDVALIMPVAWQGQDVLVVNDQGNVMSVPMSRLKLKRFDTTDGALTYWPAVVEHGL